MKSRAWNSEKITPILRKVLYHISLFLLIFYAYAVRVLNESIIYGLLWAGLLIFLYWATKGLAALICFLVGIKRKKKAKKKSKKTEAVVKVLKAVIWILALFFAGASFFKSVMDDGNKDVAISCTINTLGDGECQFTNQAWLSKKTCTKVELYNKRTGKSEYSSPICLSLIHI